MYGFEGEVKAKYTEQMADLFTEVYNWLPLAHYLNNKVLVMHGGLFSEDNVTLKDIAAIDRNKQPPAEGYFHFIHLRFLILIIFIFYITTYKTELLLLKKKIKQLINMYLSTANIKFIYMPIELDNFNR